jgi:putative cardiolipin synthase
VTVRFLLDDSFTMHEDLELHAVDTHPNISLRIYNPFRHRSDSAFWREMFNIGEFTRINHRMHNKTLVVDGRAALIGGRNLADEYFGLHETMNFRDMEVITAGVSVPGVVGHFDNFWNSGWAFSLNDIIPERDDAPELSDFRVTLAANTPLLTAPDPEELARSWRKIADVAYPGQADFYFDEPANNDPSAADEAPDQLAGVLMDLVDSANSEVILISAYLVPTPEMEALVERVEARGVNVRILTNSLRSNNHVSAHAAYRKHLNRLVMHGADLHEVRVDAADRSLYMSAPVAEKRLGLHAKVLLIDETIAYIGSSNMDPRSLKVNTEVGLVIDSLELNRAIRDRVAIDFDLRNAWAVRQNDDGKIVWISDRETLSRQPADSKFQRLEDWFIGHLPIDSQM